MTGETIVVTADRLTEPLENATDSVTVITAEELRRSQAATVAEALRDVAGVTITQSGSLGHATSAIMRGASSSQVLVLIDGVEINDPFFGGVDISSLLTSGVERIEIVRGPQSPLYGSQAMAGVINIVTAAEHTGAGGVDGTLRAEAGSMSSHRESVQLSGRSDALHWNVAGGHFDTAGQFANDEFRDLQLNGRVLWNLQPRSTLAFHGLTGDSHIGIPFNGITPSPRREGDSRLSIAGAEYDLLASPLLHLEARASYADRRDAFEDPDDAFSKTSSHNSKLGRLMAQNTMTAGPQTILFGLEHKNEDVRADSDGLLVLDETIRTTAVYAQDKIEAGSLLFTAGARVDRNSRFGSHTSPRLSAAYRVNDQWRMRAAAGQAFRAPSTGELAFPFYGNPDLKPETSTSYEAGADFQSRQATVSLTGFSTRYRDLISFDPATFIAANIDRATVHGVELSAGATLGTAWRLNAAYTHLQTRDEETGKPLYRRPRNLASVTLSYTTDALTLSGNANIVGRRFETDFETFTDRYDSGYLKVDAAASRRLRANLRATARIENVFDRQYTEVLAFPAPGRAFYAGLQVGF
ncbi:MAG TPA: TonB-dependent receptor [Thermoanaerobaculia bacterium]